MRPPVRPVALVAAVCACLLGGCGGSSHHRVRIDHHVRRRVQTVEIYSSLPLVGPSGAAGRAVQRGIRLAWTQANRRAGDFLVRYRSLNDARVGRGSWAAGPTAANARGAAVNPATMAYIGDFDSSATRVSLPILNQAGIPQIGPWSPYVGLTRAAGNDATPPGDPGRYYPTSVRTFLRLAPDDAVQAAALITAARDAGCTRMAVLRGGGSADYSLEMSGLLGLEHARLGVRIVSYATVPGAAAAPPATPSATPGSPSPAAALRRMVAALRLLAPTCLAYVGAPSAAAISAIAAVHAALPRAALFGSDRVCLAAFDSRSARSALVTASGGLLECTLPALPSGPATQEHLADQWELQYGSRPPAGPWAGYGYEAMSLVLRAIAGLGTGGDQRNLLLHALFGVTASGTLLGVFGFSSDGDSTVRAYGLWLVRAAGPPRLLRVMQPSGS